MNTTSKPHYERVHCADGFNISIQASRKHYCWPRNDDGPYESVELGRPCFGLAGGTMPDEFAAWLDYSTTDIWAYVPADAVMRLCSPRMAEWCPASCRPSLWPRRSLPRR